MNNNLKGKYFVTKNWDDGWEDVAVKFDGLRVLSIDGWNEKGDAVNVFTQQWVDSQIEDVMVTTQDTLLQDVILRQNVDLSMTFIISRRYASTTIDEQEVYDAFVDYVCNTGTFYVESSYTNKCAKVICLKGFKPTAQNLHRGNKSYIMATIPLHCVEAPQIVYDHRYVIGDETAHESMRVIAQDIDNLDGRVTNLEQETSFMDEDGFLNLSR